MLQYTIMNKDKQHNFIAIAAIGKNRELGYKGDLLWNIPSDLKYFLKNTKGHPVIMGDTTYKSLPKRPLPKRSNIVMTLDTNLQFDGVIMAHSPEEALKYAKEERGSEKIFILGGGIIYKLMLPYCDELLLTLVDDAPKADVFFPEYKDLFTETQCGDMHTENNLNFSFVKFRKTIQ
jgi:dihydrofolate reductase